MGELADFLNSPPEAQPEQPPAPSSSGGLADMLNPVTQPEGSDDFYEGLRKQKKVQGVFEKNLPDFDRRPLPLPDEGTLPGTFSSPGNEDHFAQVAYGLRKAGLSDEQAQAEMARYKQTAPAAKQQLDMQQATEDVARERAAAPWATEAEHLMKVSGLGVPFGAGLAASQEKQRLSAAADRFDQGNDSEADRRLMAESFLDARDREARGQKGAIEDVAAALPAQVLEWMLLTPAAGGAGAAAEGLAGRLGAGAATRAIAGLAARGAARTALNVPALAEGTQSGVQQGQPVSAALARSARDEFIKNVVFEGLNPFAKKAGDAAWQRVAKGFASGMSANEVAGDLQGLAGAGKLQGPLGALASAETPEEREKAWQQLVAQGVALGGLETMLNVRARAADRAQQLRGQGFSQDAVRARVTSEISATPEPDATSTSPSQTESLDQQQPAESPAPPVPAAATPPVMGPIEAGMRLEDSRRALVRDRVMETAKDVQDFEFEVRKAKVKKDFAGAVDRILNGYDFDNPAEREALRQHAYAVAGKTPPPQEAAQNAPGSTRAEPAPTATPEQKVAPAQSQTPPQATTPKELLERIDAGEGNLSAREAEVLTERLQWGTGFRELGQQMGVSHQTVKNLEKSGLAKLGHEGTVDELHLAGRAGQALADVEQGKYLSGDDLHEAGAGAVEHNARINQIGDAVEALDRLLAKKKRDATRGKLTAEKAAYYRSEFERLRGIIDEGQGQVRSPQGEPAAGAAAETPAAQPAGNVVPGAVEHPDNGAQPAAPVGAVGPEAGAPGAGAPQPADQPGAGQPVGPGAAVPPPRPEPVDPVVAAAREYAQQNSRLGLTAPGSELMGRFVDAVKQVGHGLAELAGKMAPRTTALDRESGEALTRFNAAPTYAKEAAPYYIDKVMGPDATQADRRLAGAVITERRLRRIRDVLTASGDRAAANVKTVIGHPNSPLQSEAEYQQALASPKIQGVLQRWKQEFVPVMESNYRRAEGLEDTDPIPGETQIPGEPVNLKAIGAGEQPTDSTVFTGQGRGNLKNVKLRKLGFARQAKGGAAAYDIDLGAIVENSLAKGTSLAAKAEMARTMVANGVAEWAKPGDKIDGATEVPFSRPPKGTQEAGARDVLFVRDEAYPEVRQALQVDQPMRFAGLAAFNNLMTKAALASTVEAAYHSKNLLTMFTKPGMSPVDFVQNAYKVMTKDPGAAKELVDLARIGALKEGGFESGQTSKYNPLTVLGRILGFMDRTMRLTANDAFDRLEKKGLVESSETNRRDFINQLGQYNRRAQNKLVVLLRDTGLGPFATAGTNYYMQGLRAMALDPGVKATSPQAAVQLRAEMLGRTVGVIAGAALANYLKWGRPDGDDKTPLGAIKTSEKDGKTSYFDLTAFTGLTRGLRQTGLLSLAEGARAGARENRTEDTAVDNIVSGVLHPALGPPVQFGYTAYTGKDSLGRFVAPRARGDERQWVNNLTAAIKNANPVYGSLSGAKHPGRQVPAGERLMDLAGPYGVKTRATVPGQERKRRR